MDKPELTYTSLKMDLGIVASPANIRKDPTTIVKSSILSNTTSVIALYCPFMVQTVKPCRDMGFLTIIYTLPAVPNLSEHLPSCDRPTSLSTDLYPHLLYYLAWLDTANGNTSFGAQDPAINITEKLSRCVISKTYTSVSLFFNHKFNQFHKVWIIQTDNRILLSSNQILMYNS